MRRRNRINEVKLRLKQTAQDGGFTLKAISEATSYSEASVCRYLDVRALSAPPVAFLVAFAEVTGTTTTWLIEGD